MVMHIERRDKKASLFQRLQDESIALLQELCGKVWTDFNLHDPGVTTLEILNYALYELAYKLGFPLEDYLCRGEAGTSRWEEYGLVSRGETERPCPVTAEDYERLALGSIPGLAGCRVRFRGGKYEFTISTAAGTEGKSIEGKVRKLYHAHRNLGETLGSIKFGRVAGGCEPDGFAGSTGIGNKDGRYSGTPGEPAGLSGLSETAGMPAKIPDGGRGSAMAGGYSGKRPVSVGGGGTVTGGGDVTGAGTGAVTGTGGGMGKEGTDDIREERIAGDLRARKEGCISRGVKVPVAKSVSGSFGSAGSDGSSGPVWSAGSDGSIGTGTPSGSAETPGTPPGFIGGKTRDISAHRSVTLDFPDCYGINSNGIQPLMTGSERIRTVQLREYLALFDMLFESVLAQATAIPETVIRSGPPSRLGWPGDTAPDAGELRDVEALGGVPVVNRRTVLRHRQEWMRFLCALHGEDETLFLPFTSGASPSQELEKRFAVASLLPALMRQRAGAADLNDPEGRTIPGITALFFALEGVPSDDETPVDKVFRKYSLTVVWDGCLVRDGKFLADLGWEMAEPGCLSRLAAHTGPEATPEEAVGRIPVFGKGIIPESMLVDGPDQNFWSTVIKSGGQVRLLFRHRETGAQLDMGSYTTAGEAARFAAGARRLLRILSLSSARLYVVEHILLETVPDDENGRLTIVLPWWTRRDSRKRELQRFLAERLPAHLDSRFLWLHADDLACFEKMYYPWKRAIAARDPARTEEFSLQLHAFIRFKYVTE
ncbi:MAG: hypothetical protein LUE26_01420 [Alistipes sp.]|nr:hypothetical protein [Alistipes sp.]